MRAAARLASVALLPLVAAVPAPAATISGTYFEDQTVVSCSGVLSCLAWFALPAATTGKFLTLHAISCAGIVTKPLSSGRFWLTDNNPGTTGSRRRHNLSMTGKEAAGQFSFWENVEYKVAGGPPRIINLQINTGVAANFNLECSIVGELTTQ